MRRITQSNWFWDSLMVFFLGFFCIYYGYLSLLKLEPQSVHMWRQADSASFTWHFYSSTWNLFTPKINNVLANGEGKVAIEFPILYWLGGMLYRVFGPTPIIPRMINIGVVMIGLFGFYRLTWRTVKDRFWAIVTPLFLFTSPVLVFYTNNFLPDAPALGLNLLGWAYFVRYLQEKKTSLGVWALVFQALATLVKASAGISLVTMIGLWFMEWAGWVKWNKETEEKTFTQNPGKVLGIVVLTMALIVGWYEYASYYSTQWKAEHWSPLIMPIYKTPANEWIYTITLMFTEKLPVLFLPITHLFLWILMGRALGTGGRIHPMGYAILSLTALGSIIYLSIFFGLIKVHDYYYIATLAPVAALLWFNAAWMKEKASGAFHSPVLRFLVAGFLFWNLYHAKMEMQWRYNDKPLHQKADAALYDPKLPAYLDSIGITDNYRILSLPDPSPNITLYLMRRHGWSSYGIGSATPENLASLIKGHEADFLVITDPALAQNPAVQEVLPPQIGQFGNVTMYKMHP